VSDRQDEPFQAGPGRAATPGGGGTVVFAQVEPTTRCNFICGFCSGRQMDQSDFAAEDFARLLETFPDLEHIELQGEGEPLLHRGFFDMARQARDRGIKLSMITNGSLLSPDRVAALLDAGFGSILVSIESPEERGFQSIRGGSLSKVKAGIARLLAERDRRGMTTPTVGFAITVLKQTVDTLPQIAGIYRDLGMDGGATLQPLSRMDSYAGSYDPAMAAQLLDPTDLKRMQEIIGGSPALKGILEETSLSSHFYREMAKRFPTEHGCPWVRGAVYVDRHGGIATCCMIKDTAKYGMGKLGVTPLEAVLERRRAIDDALQACRPPVQCQGCGYYRSPERREMLRRRAEARRLGKAAQVRPE
jgi:MoaA/NifB/PqqE/SkfB family radical SAM enzyme